MEVNRYHLKSPVEIITIYLGIPQDYKQQCINEIYKIGDKQNYNTNVKAIMSSYQIWEETEVLNSLIDKIAKTITNITPTMVKSSKLEIIECWSAIYKKNNYTIPHTHHPRYLSFVYYLKSNPTSSSPLVFDKCDFNISPKDDMLVIFPSYLEHSVPSHLNEEDRICLAGNLNIEIISNT